MNPRRILAPLLLLAVLAAAFGLRVGGAGFGLDVGAPEDFSYHLDEPKLVTRAIGVARSGDPELRWFHYPSFQIYATALALGLAPEGVHPYRVARTLTAILGTAGVGIAFLLARRLSGPPAGLLAAALLGVSFLHGRSSHYATTDVPMASFAAASAWFAIRFAQSRGGRGLDLWLSFAAVGLAAGTKYNGASTLLIPVLAGLLGRPGESRSIAARGARVAAGGLLAAGVFVLTTPYALLYPEAFRDWFGYIHEFQQRGQSGFDQPGFLSNLGYLSSYLGRWAVGPLGALLAVLGVGLALGGGQRRAALPAVAFVFAHVVWIATYPISYPRNAMPIVPLLAVFAGVAFGAGLGAAQRRLGSKRGAAAAVLVAVALLAVPARDSLHLVRSFAQPTRTTALPWFEANLPEGARVLHEVYSPPLEIRFPRRWELVPVWNLGHALPDPGWLRRERIDFVISSSGASEMVFSHPGRYPRAERSYAALAQLCDEMARFEGNLQDPLYSSISPTLRVFDCRTPDRR